jgi:hypothetical protein
MVMASEEAGETRGGGGDGGSGESGSTEQHAGVPLTARGFFCPCACCGANEAPSPELRLRKRRVRDAYARESILVHEFAHCVMDVGLDEAARDRIRAAHKAALAAGLVDDASYMGSNASEYWAESAQAWFDASVRCDVNCGLNSREELSRRDPDVAAELLLAFGNGAWRYTHVLAAAAPRRAEAWAIAGAQRERVRSQRTYQLMVPICACFRRHRTQLEAMAVSAGRTPPGTGKQWRTGQPLCPRCERIVSLARESAGLR